MTKLIRIDKLLSNMGYGSRRQVKELLRKGLVRLGDQIIRDGSLTVHPEQSDLYCDNHRVTYRKYIYVMMNKPSGILSATEDEFEKTVIDLLPKGIQCFHPFPVGRLDRDTIGLLLITNDGAFAHDLLSPKKHITKIYEAIIAGKVTEIDQKTFQEGILLMPENYWTLPAKLSILRSDHTSLVHIAITEGKYHQIKRMFAAVGKSVLSLKRIQFGSLQLDENLPEGQWRELNQCEIQLLKKKLPR